MNPLLAGLVAFGAGALVATFWNKSEEKERRAIYLVILTITEGFARDGERDVNKLTRLAVRLAVALLEAPELKVRDIAVQLKELSEKKQKFTREDAESLSKNRRLFVFRRAIAEVKKLAPITDHVKNSFHGVAAAMSIPVDVAETLLGPTVSVAENWNTFYMAVLKIERRELSPALIDQKGAERAEELKLACEAGPYDEKEAELSAQDIKEAVEKLKKHVD